MHRKRSFQPYCATAFIVAIKNKIKAAHGAPHTVRLVRGVIAMKRVTSDLVRATAWAVICAPFFSLLPGSCVQAQELNVSSGEHNVQHPTNPSKGPRAKGPNCRQSTGFRIQHSLNNGGPVMTIHKIAPSNFTGDFMRCLLGCGAA